MEVKKIDNPIREFDSVFKVFGPINRLPNFKDLGLLPTEEPYIGEAKELSKKLKFDEYQAVLTKPLNDCWQDDVWEYKEVLYSYITTLRKHGNSVEVITANILTFTTIEDKKYLLLQQRSQNSGLYPGYYSIFGGSFSPKDDNNNIYLTAVREIYEEIDGITTSQDEMLLNVKDSKYLLTQETDNGNLQINFLGVEIDISKDAKGTLDEGNIVKVKIEKIDEFLEKNRDKITPLALSCLEMI